jgi:DNA topoisomerase-3
MKTLKPLSQYDRLWRAGLSRQVADWLVGMNGSRAASVRMNDTFSVGRVQTAVLALLVDRRRERENFKPEPYWLLRALFSNKKGSWWGSWFKDTRTRFDGEKEATSILAKIEGETGIVASVKKQKKKQPPPLLYSLTELQRDANRKFGFSARKTLNIAQTLYEDKKCLSYPRTDSKVLGTKNVGLARRLVEKLSGAYPKTFAGVEPGLISSSNRRVFNDSKLTDHHALIPLAPLPENAKQDEEKVYELVLKRFAAAFHPDCEYEQTEILTEVQKETFRTRGTRILKSGWRVVYGEEDWQEMATADEQEESNLPPIDQGDPAKVDDTKLGKKKTSPPPEYTEALLLADMVNPGKYVSEDELKEIYRGEVGLGTQATRAQIIEILLKRSYVERRRKHLVATEKGCVLIDTLRQFKVAKSLTSPEETARWEMKLNQIAQGHGSETQFLKGIKKFVVQTVEEFKFGAPQTYKRPTRQLPEAAVLGTCPACGGQVIETKKGYGCSKWRDQDGGCKFVIWKEIAGKRISKKVAKQLLKHSMTGTIEGFRSKKGNSFSARLKLESDGSGPPKVLFDFKTHAGRVSRA